MDPLISVVIPCHNEKKVLERAARSVLMQIEPPDFELIFVLDRASDHTKAIVSQFKDISRPKEMVSEPTFIVVDHGDLGLSRNIGVSAARGRFVSFLDADDIFGGKWLRNALDFARQFDHDNFILHPEWSVMFGSMNFVHRHFSCNASCFDARDLIQYNPWSALAFAPKAVLRQYQYESTGSGFGFEDWHFNTRTLGAGVPHYCVPNAVHFIRMKQDETSLAKRTVDSHATIRAMSLFDKRDLKHAEHLPPRADVPLDVVKQALYAHHEVGEKRILLEPQMELQIYPRQAVFDDAAWLRDQIGPSKHVVLVDRLLPGGAEKYGIDWCEALKNHNPTIIETEAQEFGPWRPRAAKFAKVVPWFRRNQLDPIQSKIALQRALVQSQLDSIFVCNSPMGWALLRENPEALAKRVFTASFADILMPTGFTSCAPYHNVKTTHLYTTITDNQSHAGKMAAYVDDIRIACIEPMARVEGGPHRSQLAKERPAVLWAGRGSDEKRPMMIAILSQLLPEVDFHVWGEVNLPRYFPNLKLRGQFNHFGEIQGAYDCYLLTSIMEGMPNTALEAVLCGLPVISSNVGDVGRVAAATFESKAHKPIEQTAQNAAAAIQSWFSIGRENYDHSIPLARVQHWQAQFPMKVIDLATKDAS